jgi:glycosyltransferase involved in cell wall biosynthesis
MSSKTELSVVIIGKNEADKICGCIEATLEATKDLCTEIVYVDSISTDGTIEAASKYDITILSLEGQLVVSAAAGRYIGTIYSKSDYIMFCDGDIQICKDWPKKALDYLKEHENVGGVGGYLIYHFPDNTSDTAIPFFTALKKNDSKVIFCKSLTGGVCMYRRNALETAGHFNPYLYAEEEWDVGQRIRYARFKLAQLPICSGNHYTVRRLSCKGIFKRKKIYDCYTQLIQLGKGRKGFWWEFSIGPLKYILFYNAVTILLVSIAVIGVLLRANKWFFVFPLILLFTIVTFFNIRRGTIIAFPIFIFRSIYMIWRTIITLHKYKRMSAKDYPTSIKVIKRQHQ